LSLHPRVSSAIFIIKYAGISVHNRPEEIYRSD
jgi:hypothetical protein